MVGFLRRLPDRGTYRVGMFGLTSGCGLTHVSIAAANYFASKERRSVLYLERGAALGEKACPKGSVISFRTKKTLSVAGISGFERDGVHYMPLCAPEDIRRLLAERYDVIVAEVKGWGEGAAVLRPGMFDRRVWMFSAKPWKYPELQTKMRQLIRENAGEGQGEYCSFGLTYQEEKTLFADFHLKSREIPFIRDPFHLKKEDIRFLKEFLKM